LLFCHDASPLPFLSRANVKNRVTRTLIVHENEVDHAEKTVTPGAVWQKKGDSIGEGSPFC
jgi:hypothetical protein